MISNQGRMILIGPAPRSGRPRGRPSLAFHWLRNSWEFRYLFRRSGRPRAVRRSRFIGFGILGNSATKTCPYSIPSDSESTTVRTSLGIPVGSRRLTPAAMMKSLMALKYWL